LVSVAQTHPRHTRGTAGAMKYKVYSTSVQKEYLINCSKVSLSTCRCSCYWFHWNYSCLQLVLDL